MEITKAKQIILHIWRGEIDKAIEAIMDEVRQEPKSEVSETFMRRTTLKINLLEERLNGMQIIANGQGKKIDDIEEFRQLMTQASNEAAMKKAEEEKNEKKEESCEALAKEEEEAGDGKEKCDGADAPKKAAGEKPVKRKTAKTPMYDRICVVCGQKFKARSGAAKVCPSCKEAGKTKPSDINTAEFAREIAAMDDEEIMQEQDNMTGSMNL